MMIDECAIRKIDNVGRVSIPKHLRTKFKMNEGCDVNIFTYVDENGKAYVCFALKENIRDEN